MEILIGPHKELLTPTRQVRVFGPELLVLLNAMFDTMQKHKGLGLAANQVGLDLSMFVMLGQNDEKMFFINPRITAKSLVSANIKEGCLSFPGEFLILSERASWVEVIFQDENGSEKKAVFKGLRAVCVQHEIDHLLGKVHLQSKSIPREKRKQLAKKWKLK